MPRGSMKSKSTKQRRKAAPMEDTAKKSRKSTKRTKMTAFAAVGKRDGAGKKTGGGKKMMGSTRKKRGSGRK